MSKQIKLVGLMMLIFASSNILKAQTTIEEFTNDFFYLYENSFDEAFSFLTKDTLKNADHLTVDNLKRQFLNSIARIGFYTGYEKILENSVGNSLMLVTYLIKHEKRPYRLSTILYKPKDKWVILEFNIDEKPIADLKESWKKE